MIKTDHPFRPAAKVLLQAQAQRRIHLECRAPVPLGNIGARFDRGYFDRASGGSGVVVADQKSARFAGVRGFAEINNLPQIGWGNDDHGWGTRVTVPAARPVA